MKFLEMYLVVIKTKFLGHEQNIVLGIITVPQAYIHLVLVYQTMVGGMIQGLQVLLEMYLGQVLQIYRMLKFTLQYGRHMQHVDWPASTYTPYSTSSNSGYVDENNANAHPTIDAVDKWHYNQFSAEVDYTTHSYQP